MCRMCGCPVAREYEEDVYVPDVWLSCGPRVWGKRVCGGWGKRVCAGCVGFLWPESMGK